MFAVLFTIAGIRVDGRFVPFVVLFIGIRVRYGLVIFVVLMAIFLVRICFTIFVFAEYSDLLNQG